MGEDAGGDQVSRHRVKSLRVIPSEAVGMTPHRERAPRPDKGVEFEGAVSGVVSGAHSGVVSGATAAFRLNLTPTEDLDLMIANGWGDTPQVDLPTDWRVRKNPKGSGW